MFLSRRSDVEKYSTLADFTKDDLKLIEKVLRKYNIPCDQLANNTVVSHCEYLSEIMLNRLPYDFEERLRQLLFLRVENIKILALWQLLIISML